MSIFNPFKFTPFRVKNKELVGIEFGKNILKIASIRTFSYRKEVTRLFSKDINGLSDADISRILKDSFAELKVKQQEVVSVIPTSLVITKNIEIPSVDPQEIREIINLQAGRHTPYSRNEIIVDYIDLGVYKHNYTKILLVIVTRSAVNRQSDILNNAGFKLIKVLFAPEGLMRFISKANKVDTESSPVSIIHIDADSTDFTTVFKNKVLFIRSIPIGTQYLLGDEAEKYKFKFAEELKGSLEVYQNEDIERNPDRLVLTGAAEQIQGLDRVLNDTLRLPISIIPYLKNMAASNYALKTATASKRLSFLNLIAPLLSEEESKIDLIPDEVRLSRSLEEKGRDLIRLGILVLTVFILVFFILASSIYFKNIYLKKLNARYQTLNEEARKLQDEFTRVSLIKKYLAGRGYSLEVLSELYNIVPLEMEFNDIRYDSQGKLSLRGTAESMTVVFSVVDNMEKSKYFKDVKTRYTTKRREGLKDVTDFEITCLLENKAGE